MSLPVEKSEPSLKVFDDEYDRAYLQGMRNKVRQTYECVVFSIACIFRL